MGRRLPKNTWHIWLGLVCAGTAVRITSMLSGEHASASSMIAWPLLRGLCSDMVIALLVTLFCVCLAHRAWLAIVMAIPYCLALAGNIAFIAENSSNLDFGMVNQAADINFIRSTIGSPRLAGEAVYVLVLFFVVYWLSRRFLLRYAQGKWLIIINITALILCIIPVSSEIPRWRWMNLVEDNVRSAVHKNAFDTSADPKLSWRFFAKDVSGTKLVDFPSSKPNVLLIILESVGMEHITRGKMPFLQSLSKNSLFYPNYFTSSSVTLNGEYAILCGDSPALVSPRPGAVKAWGLGRQPGEYYCLPRLLANNGYQTLYMQSAAIGFQQKHRFLSRTGFDRLIGRDELESPGGDWGTWGPDDAGLYAQAFDTIVTMRKEGRPWFLTLMTISTHFPSNIPSSYTDSFAFADDAVRDFIAKLRESGIAKDTLILITNDEVRINAKGPFPKSLLQRNHGVMMVLTPENDVRTIPATYGQTDVFLSIADYLGLSTQFIDYGHSLFRRYKKPWPVFFGNFYSPYIVVMPDGKTLLTCTASDLTCRQFSVGPKGLFVGKITPAPLNSTFIPLIKSLVKRNDTRTVRKWNGDATPVRVKLSDPAKLEAIPQ